MTFRGNTTVKRAIRKYQSTLQNVRPIKNHPSTFIHNVHSNMKPTETNQKIQRNKKSNSGMDFGSKLSGKTAYKLLEKQFMVNAIGYLSALSVNFFNVIKIYKILLTL